MNKYIFTEYDSNFPKLFQKEKIKIRKILGEVNIEHVGSTSVQGLGGKGIIDIVIFASNKIISNYMKKLEKIGYEYVPHPGDDLRKFMQKIIKYAGKERRVHIHLTQDKKMWESFVAFRDYLIEHPELKKEYSKIKKEAVKRANGDRLIYREHKQDFLKKIARLAMEKTK